MTRPRRLYKSGKEADIKYYYLIKGKKVFVKVPDKVSQKQIQKVNIKNIITIPEARRIKRKRKKTGMTYEKKIDKNMVQGLSSYYSFVPERVVKPIQEQFAKNIEKTKDTTVEKLTGIIGKLAIQSKLPLATIEESKGQEEIPSSNIPNPRGPQAKIGAAKLAERVYEKHKKIYPPFEEVDKIMPSGVKKTGAQFILDNKLYKDTKKEFDKILESEKKKMAITPPSLSRTTSLNREGSETSIGSARSASSFGQRLVSAAKKFVAGSTIIPEDEDEVPSGGGNVEDGLYTDQVETIARKRLKHFVPVIANDKTEDLMKYVKRGDKEFAFIINTDDSGESGRHWRCVYIDNRDDYKTVEFYDSLTETKIPENVRAIAKKICIKMNPEMLFKFKSNAIRQQATTSSRCGIHCINFLEQRHNGIPFSEATGYDTFINELKSKGDIDGSEKGEIELSKKIPMYQSYI